jgi:maleylacetoacetate isomerase
LPGTAFDRAHVRALALSIACEIHALQNLRVLGYLKTNFGQDQSGLDRWCRHWIETGLAAFEATLAAHGTTGTYCFGDAPTLADVCLVPQVFSAARFGADISGLTNIQRIAKACDANPAFAAAHPARQPDAEA